MENLLSLEELMNQRQDPTEEMVALLLIAFVTGLSLAVSCASGFFPRKHLQVQALFRPVRLP
jgi:hypothetical protein